MRRPGTLTEADLSDWASCARDVVPLPGRQPAELPAVNAPGEGEPPAASAASAGAARRHRRSPAPPLIVGDQPPGIDTATWERLRSGRLAPARSLDLHGFTVEHAYRALLTELRAAHADRLRCIEVITGRGSGENGGAIRRELPFWLNRPELRPLVLAAAHPPPGNQGATRLLLRRPRQPRHEPA